MPSGPVRIALVAGLAALALTAFAPAFAQSDRPPDRQPRAELAVPAVLLGFIGAALLRSRRRPMR